MSDNRYRTKLVTNLDMLVKRIPSVEQEVQSVVILEYEAGAMNDGTMLRAVRLFRRHSEDPGYPFVEDAEVTFKEVDPSTAVALLEVHRVDQDGHDFVEKSATMTVHPKLPPGVRA